MSMMDNFYRLLKPIADNYSNPRTAAAGIIGLFNPGLGMALRYGPEIVSVLQGPYQAGGGSGLGARGGSSGGMSGMVPSSLAGNPGGVGGKHGLPLSDLTQYLQRGRALDDSDIKGNIPTMNKGGEVQLLNPNMPPGSRNPYLPTRVAPPTGMTYGSNDDLIRAAPSRGVGSLGDILQMLNQGRGRGRRGNPIIPPGKRPTLLPMTSTVDSVQGFIPKPYNPPGMQEGGTVRTGQFIDANNNGIDDRDEIVDERIPVYAGGTPGFYDGGFGQDRVGMPVASAPPSTQESLFGPDASAVMKEAMLEYGGSRSPYEGFAEYFSRPVYDRSTPQAPPESAPMPDPVLGADDPRANLDDRIAQLMDPGRQGLTREEALEQQLRSISKGYDINNDGVVTNAEFQMSMNPDFTGVESRIQELMDSGMTRLEALAKQSYGIQQGYDLNNDGMVTNAEYAEFMRNQPAAATPAPEAAAETIAATSPQQAFLNTLGTVQGATQAADASPPVADSVQQMIDGIRAQGIPGIFGGNFDLTALQQQIADYLESIGYQAPGATDQQQTAMPVPDRAVVDRVRTPVIMR